MVHISAARYATWLHRLMATGGLLCTGLWMYSL